MASTKPITYQRLLRALKALHFSRDTTRSAKGHVTLARPGSDVPIILPVVLPEEPVTAAHLAMVRVVLRETSPGGEEQLDLLLGSSVRRGTNGKHHPEAGPNAPLATKTRAVK